MKSKLLSILLCCALLLCGASVIAVSGVAASDATITLTPSGSPSLGQTVDVTVNISANSYLVNTDMLLTYDAAKLQLVENSYAANTTLFPSSSLYEGNAPSAGLFRFSLALSDDVGIKAGGELFRLQFRVIANDVESTTVNLTASPFRGNDGTGSSSGSNYVDDYDIQHTVVPAVIYITGAEIPTTTEVPPMGNEHIDLLSESKIAGETNIDLYHSGASWIIESKGSGAQLALSGCGAYDANKYPYLHIGITSDVPFVVAFYDGANNKWMTSTGDFYPDFKCTTGDTPAAAGTYTLSLYTKGCYTWSPNGELPLPATVSLDSIYIEPQAKGTMVINHLALSSLESYCAFPDPTKPTATPTTTTTVTSPEPATTTTAAPQPPVSGDHFDLLLSEKVDSTRDADLTQVGSDWILEAHGDDAQLAIIGCGDYDASKYPYIHIGITSDVPFNVAFRENTRDAWIQAISDFSNDFPLEGGLVKPGTYTLSLSIEGFYTYFGYDPKTANLHSIYIEPHGEGTVVINHLALSPLADYCNIPAPTATTAVPSTTTTQAPPPAVVPGDFNGNGEPDVEDSLALYQYVSGKVTLSAEHQKIADMDNDGKIDIIDALILYIAASGK